MHKHNFGQTLKLQSAVVTVNIRSWILKILFTLFCLQTMYLCKFGGENPTGSEDRAQKRLNLQFFKDDDLENEMTLKFRSRSPKSYQLFILPQ